jgi:hypothetical protein
MDMHMSSNRHVPRILGVIALFLAFYFMGTFSGWWKYIVGTFLFIFGYVSLKTALFASDQEIKELTGTGPASEETMKKLRDRI